MEQHHIDNPIDIGCVPLDEIRLVHGATQLVNWDSDSMAGPIVRCENGRRIWESTSDDAAIFVKGDVCTFEETFMFSRQFIENCLPLARLDDNIHLTVVDKKVTANSPSGSISMFCGPSISRFEEIDEIDSVTATMPFRHLFRALDTASDLPSNISEHVIHTNPEPPATVLKISEGKLTCTTNWKPYGSHEVTTTTPANTLGTGSIAINSQTVNRMIHTIGLLGNSEFTISFDQLSGNYIKFSSLKVFIALKRTLTGADAIHFQICKTLEKLLQKYTVNDRGNIIVVIENRPITISVLEQNDGNDHLIRLSHTIVRNASTTLDLLKEINVSNQMLAKNKIWIDKDRVNIGLDIQGNEANEIYSHLQVIVADANKLDGVLQPLSA